MLALIHLCLPTTNFLTLLRATALDDTFPVRCVTHIWFFLSSKICVSPTSIISFLFPFRWHLSNNRRRHSVVLCHASFSWSQDEIDASTSSFGNTSSRCLPSWAETEALNHTTVVNHPPCTVWLSSFTAIKRSSQFCPTLTTTQLYLYFTSSLARAPHYQSSIRRHHSLSLPSHAHHPSR
jgi:hypothetical protein